MMRFSLFQALIRELGEQATFDRTSPKEIEATGSEEAGEEYLDCNTALAGVSLYHLAQMCRIIQPGRVVLSIGCGCPSLLEDVARLNPRAEFIAIDPSTRRLAHATERVTRTAANVDLRPGSLSDLSTIAANSFDVVISSMTFHRLANKFELHQAISEIDRVLKPEGHLYIHDFGRVRSLISVNYYAKKFGHNVSKAAEKEYQHALRTAFSIGDFRAAGATSRDRTLRAYTTPICPLIVVLASRPSQPLIIQRREIKHRYQALSKACRHDFNLLKWLLMAGGLSSPL